MTTALAKPSTPSIDLLRRTFKAPQSAPDDGGLDPQEDLDAHDLGEPLVDERNKYYLFRLGTYYVARLNVAGESHIHELAFPRPSPRDLRTP